MTSRKSERGKSPDGKFPKREHLLKTKDFRTVYKKGVSAKSVALIMYAAKNGIDVTRLGVSIPSRYVKRASARNRIKRVIREAFRLSKNKFTAGIDIVVLAKKDISSSISLNSACSLLLGMAKSMGFLI